MLRSFRGPATPAIRPPSVAGSFYDADPGALDRDVARHLAAAAAGPIGDATATAEALTGEILGLLVPHAGLVYSGTSAAAAWRALAPDPPATVVILGTNHGASWLEGIGAWETGSWRTPLGEVAVDQALARRILALGRPLAIDRDAHLGEHSIEVQLPLLQRVAPAAAIVPLAVATGTGQAAITAGEHLGRLLAGERAAGRSIVLVASSDTAHYPTEAVARRVNERLRPHVERVDPAGLAAEERAIRREGLPSVACGMCGIEPTVVGLAVVRAMGATRGTILAATTSADAYGDRRRTVGYVAAAFTG
jgi:AmmeMemoRadiSam system protein B